MNKFAFYQSLKKDPLRNYAGIPGVTSWMINDFGDKGLIRMFESEREHQEIIIPHSHRYGFYCEVLKGRVENITWTKSFSSGDMCQEVEMKYMGTPGVFERSLGKQHRYTTKREIYHTGSHYAMEANEIHSIFFGRDTVVLFHQGSDVTDTSVILEPVVSGKMIETFEVKPWAYSKD